MFRTALLSVMVVISVSSSSLSESILRKSLVRRQTDGSHCKAIEGFECKCLFSRVTCTTTHDLTTPINILENEKHKYESVELVIGGAHDIKVDDRTFETVKQLYKNDADSFEFRVKFENFIGLHLSSSRIFNQVFPDNSELPVRKHLALEIYNPNVEPNENWHLFQNLNVDRLEVYALYPFHGSFQELFDGANIKYLRLSGGDIHSDLSKSFTGNIAQLELAKQASILSVQNFPVYPAHELIINAFYITEFNSEHPPNYSNLGELRVYSIERIPSNAFQQFPNIHTLSITTDKDVDPKALDGLNNLEKLTIKEAKPSIAVLNNLPNVKEFETNIEQLDEESQCELISKLVNGQVVVQAISNGRECTCIAAYLKAAIDRTSCNVQDCDRSTCSAIKNNYDSSTNTFKSPPVVLRADGTNALNQRQPKVYTEPYQVSNVDREKLHQGTSQHTQHSQHEHDHQRPSYNEQTSEQEDQHNQRPEFQTGSDQNENREEDEQRKLNDNGDTQQEEKTNENQNDAKANQADSSDLNVDNDGSANSGTQTEESSKPARKEINWLPIIIIVAAILILLLIVIVIVALRKRSSNSKGGYDPASTNDQSAPRA